MWRDDGKFLSCKFGEYMEIKEAYIRKYWEKIVADQLADELQQKKYKVEREKKVDDICFDLYATKGDEHIIYEIKQGRFSKNSIEQLQQYAKEHGARLRLVISNYADTLPSINIDFFPSLLCDYMNTYHPHNEIAYSDTVEDISDISYTMLQMDESELKLKGNATCDFEIHMDNKGDIDFDMSFPMSFEVQLIHQNGQWDIDESNTEIDVDDSKFYE